jgi:hypothetical protein
MPAQFRTDAPSDAQPMNRTRKEKTMSNRALALALAVPLSALAADNAPPEALHVKVYADRYVAAGKAFADVAALESWAKPILIRSVWLDICGPSSTPQLLAAVERFHAAYSDGMQIRVPGARQAACPPAARADAGHLATDEHGRGLLP